MVSNKCIICETQYLAYKYKIDKGLKKTCSKECASVYRGLRIRKPESEKFDMKSYNKAYYQENKEKIKAQVEQYKKITGYKHKLSEEQKAKSRARAKAWYQANKQVMIDRAKEWKKSNPDKVNAGSRSYASRRRGAEGKYSVADYLKIKNRQGGLCAYCQDNKANSIDHIVPLSRGGSNYIGNILPVCGYCNSSKGAKTLYEWKVLNGRLLSI